MLKAFLGHPGAGKGVYTVIQTEEALRTTSFPIITNFAFHVMPWTRTLDARQKRSRQEQGFMNYMLNKYGDSCDVENRIHILSDEEFKEFFLYRVDFEGKLFKVDCERDKTGKIVDFDKAAYSRSQPCIYIMDEGWKFVWARNWQTFSFGFQMYMAQHRHAGDDVWMSFQTEGQPDKAVRDMIQEWHSLVNHKHRKIGFFRQPNMISVMISNERPSQREKSLHALPKLIKFDPKGVGSCFDTAGAIGGTSVAGDIERKPKGLPTWMLIFAIIGVGCFIVLGARGMGWFSGKLLTGTLGKSIPARAMVAGAKKMQEPWNPLKLPVPVQQQQSAESVQVKEPVYMVGWASRPLILKNGFPSSAKLTSVYLSDGSEYVNGDGHLQYLCPRYCIIDGRTNLYRPRGVSSGSRSLFENY